MAARFVAVQRAAPVLRRPVEPALLAMLCREALGPGARLQSPALIGEGHFNTSYRLDLADGRRVVLRLGPESGDRLWRHEQQMMARECSVQPLLQSLGELIPRLLHADTSRRLVPRDWSVFEHRPGVVWETVMPRLRASDNEALWRDYGALVARLHALQGDRFGFPAPAAAHGSVSGWFIDLIDGLSSDLAEQGVAVPALDDFRALIALPASRARLDAAVPAGQPPRLVHGDLWPRNVLVQEGPQGWRLSALLDAERAFFGDPSAEWIFGFLDLPEAYWAAYGQRLGDADLHGDALWRRRAYQARGALQMMLEGCRFGFDAGFAQQQFARCCSDLGCMGPNDAAAGLDAPGTPIHRPVAGTRPAALA